jgi:hypothetical protein
LFPLRRSTRVVPLVLGLAVLGGCVTPDPPGVAIKPLKADIVFGVKEPEPAVPASFEPPSAEPGDEDDELVLPPQPSGILNGPAKPKTRVPLLRAADPCPAAKLNAFPAIEATRSVANQPVPGVYKWKQTGTVVRDVGGQKYTVAINRFEQRAITNVSPISSVPNPTALDPTDPANDTKTFTFDVIQKLEGGSKRTTYQVRTSSLGVRQQPGLEVPRPAVPDLPSQVPVTSPTTSAPPDLPDAVVVGDPERGVTIKKIEDLDNDGKVLRTVAFSTGVQVLPLAVLPDETFRSVGVDTTNQVTLVHDGIVKNRNRVDACGEIIDGWEVAINATLVDGENTQQSTETFYIATQYGAMPIFESFNYGENGNLANNIGQLNPDPLPS